MKKNESLADSINWTDIHLYLTGAGSEGEHGYVRDLLRLRNGECRSVYAGHKVKDQLCHAQDVEDGTTT